MVYLSGVILECPKGPQMVALGTSLLHAPHAHRARTARVTPPQECGLAGAGIHRRGCAAAEMRGGM